MKQIYICEEKSLIGLPSDARSSRCGCCKGREHSEMGIFNEKYFYLVNRQYLAIFYLVLDLDGITSTESQC